MTPIEAMTLIAGLAQEIAHGVAAVLHALPALMAAGIQVAAEGAATASGMAAEAAARPEVVLRRLRFLSLAYTTVWVILAAYLVLLSLRQRRLERQIRRLRERLGA